MAVMTDKDNTGTGNGSKGKEKEEITPYSAVIADLENIRIELERLSKERDELEATYIAEKERIRKQEELIFAKDEKKTPNPKPRTEVRAHSLLPFNI